MSRQQNKSVHNKKGTAHNMWVDKAAYVFVFLYIIFMPFVSAFAIKSSLTISLIFSLFLFSILILRVFLFGNFLKNWLDIDYLLILLFIITSLISYLYNGLANPKSLNHTIAYFSTFTFFYLTVKYSLFSLGNKKGFEIFILKSICFTTIFCCLFGCLEYVLNNSYSININEYIPRPSDGEKFYDATAIEFLVRSRGFAPESGHFAFMIELFGPLSVYYLYFSNHCNWWKIIKLISLIIIILGVVVSFSSAAFVIIPFSIIFSLFVGYKYVFHWIKNLTRTGLILFFGQLLCFISLLVYLIPKSLFILNITDKLGSRSFDDRQDRNSFFLKQFSELPFIHKIIGVGPCGFGNLGFDESRSILSLYYTITFETGILGLIIFLCFLLYCFNNILSIKSRIRFFLLISFLSGLIHYWFISNYWYPWFWFILAFAMYYKYRQREMNFNS